MTPVHPRELASLVIESLNLEGMEAGQVDLAAPLFGEGLGLDSIDVLEVVASIEKDFGIAIRSQEEGERVLKSIDSIARFLVEQGYQGA